MKTLPYRGKIVNFLTILIVPLVVSISACSEKGTQAGFDPVELVNPLMGTDSEFRLSNGNTYPAIALP